MTEIALECIEISKKFRKGESFNSLRDFIPALVGRTFRNTDGELKKREFWALKDVSFEVERGEAFGIIGHNGAGKSTILKLLSGVMKATKGRIGVKGRLSALIEVGAGFHSDLTGRENVFLNGTILGMKREEIKRKYEEIVEFSGLEEFMDTPVKRYSSGMYARLGFSVAAHVNPDILVVDEVLSVGDYTFQKKCVDKMKSVIKGGSTVIFVSHNLNAVIDVCNRGLLLNSGKVILQGSANDIVKAYIAQSSVSQMEVSEKKAVFISKVTLRNEKGECINFKSGEKAWIDIEVRAREKCEGLAVVLKVMDSNKYEIFNASTQRLGLGAFSTNPGDIFLFTVELDLHFGSGSYDLGVLIYQSSLAKIYDIRFPTTTIFISNDEDVRGVVNLYPKVKIEKQSSREWEASS